MNIAVEVSRRSTCIRKDRKIGSIVINQNREVVGTGYNGNARKMKHCSEIGCIRDKEGVVTGERVELCTGVHAEMNALLKAGRKSEGGTMYTIYNPCPICSALIVNAGIVRVVYQKEYPDKRGVELMEACGIEVSKMEEVK